MWVDIPSELYDPVRGHQVHNTYLDQLESPRRRLTMTLGGQARQDIDADLVLAELRLIFFELKPPRQPATSIAMVPGSARPKNNLPTVGHSR